jgi:hypothetical protein
VDPGEVGYEAAKRRAVGKQDGEVIEAEAAPPGHRQGAGPLLELHQRQVVAVGSQRGQPAVLIEEAEAEDVLVEGERAGQLGYLESYRAKAEVVGKAAAGCGHR